MTVRTIPIKGTMTMGHVRSFEVLTSHVAHTPPRGGKQLAHTVAFDFPATNAYMAGQHRRCRRYLEIHSP